MNKELFLATLLLANPIASMSEERITQVKSIKNEVRKNLISRKFISVPVLMSEWVFQDNGDYTEIEVMNHIQLSFINSSEPPTTWNHETQDYEDFNVDAEVEVNFIRANANDSHRGSDSFFFAKKIGHNKFRIYDCDSSANCSEDFSINIEIVESKEGSILKVLSANSDVREDSVFGMLVANPLLSENVQ